MRLPHIANVDLVQQWVIYLRPVVVQTKAIRFCSAIDWKNKLSKNQFTLMGKELVKNAFHLWSRIILLEYGWWPALNVWEEGGFQHLRDAALVVQCTGNTY
ncbi:hypothetical protein TNCV_694091 [Trichonephila clavipes]|nr:hypothetical protein TNCV_694091 [Trichonephila clavipes]